MEEDDPTFLTWGQLQYTSTHITDEEDTTGRTQIDNAWDGHQRQHHQRFSVNLVSCVMTKTDPDPRTRALLSES